jgi:nitroimidazol reductase NimA-like FMN-containing flavoprotein (pyridoxamine 5'-phosphate oxidase superfamily)
MKLVLKGQKVNNIELNSKVCVEVHEMIELLHENIDKACDTNVAYNSIIILGYAKILKDHDMKREILNKIVDKYTPQFFGKVLPDNMVSGTCVIEVEIKECTGKYYR